MVIALHNTARIIWKYIKTKKLCEFHFGARGAHLGRFAPSRNFRRASTWEGFGTNSHSQPAFWSETGFNENIYPHAEGLKVLVISGMARKFLETLRTASMAEPQLGENSQSWRQAELVFKFSENFCTNVSSMLPNRAGKTQNQIKIHKRKIAWAAGKQTQITCPGQLSNRPGKLVSDHY